MRKVAFLVAVLGFALVSVGCRDISPDLHDIHTITFNPVVRLFDAYFQEHQYGAVNGTRGITLETDVWGRVARLPTPQWGRWIWECGLHDWPGECEVYNCGQFTWTFEPAVDGPRFLGWYTSGGITAGGPRVTERTVFNADTTIFARWHDDDVTTPAPGSVAAQLAELRGMPGTPFAFSITVNADEYLDPQVLDFDGAPIAVTLTGILPTRTDFWGNVYIGETYTGLSLRTPGAMFTVGSNVTLILQNVELWGFHRNHTSLIVVENGGTVIIRENAQLAWNNTDSNRFGGAVTVQTGGELVMEGGRIRQNVFRHPRLGANAVVGGAGVWVRGGTFTMTDGMMDENVALGGGGAVRVSHGGTFVMEGGLLYDNASFIGAGVFVGGGSDGEFDPDGTSRGGSTFIMRDGAIENNFSPLFGAGVSVGLLGRFEMHGGDIFLNEGADGVGVDNEGVTILHDGFIWFNTSLRGATGGVSNFHQLEMWGGLIGVNEGGFGGGVRNLGDFRMFGGSIQGNIGNGGPAGGVVNIAQFHMHGGEISNNISSVQGGGIVHGLSGNINSGQFVVTGGMIWNNRDLTTHHESGLPGSMGNIRRSHPNADSFVLGRLGFFSLNAADLPGGGWTMTSGSVPVFDGALPMPRPSNHPAGSVWQWDWYNRSGTIPPGWPVQTVFFFAPPTPTYPVWAYQMPWTVGRPRVEINTVNNPSNIPMLVMDTDVPAVSNHQPNVRDRRPIRGGVTFPSSLVTQHTDEGFAWRVRHGHMTADTLTGFSWSLADGTPVNLSTVDGWPVPPTIVLLTSNAGSGSLNVHLPTLPLAGAWPWVQGTTLHQPLADDWHPPLLASAPLEVTAQEHPTMERLRERFPDWQEHLHQRIHHQPSWPLQTGEDILEHRQRLLDEPPQQLMQRLENMVDELIEYQSAGREGDVGFVPFGR